ncbi:shikimate dehydrogenase [Ferrovibrio sp.]|uniref:shikimate dehydrogenase n=1 Tax=Ferrovibrio sp. TaxID=1917215 RepID=UPI00263104AB|nr:shikimate dehydrogenase [Ferrovibrio sp.]
MQRRFLVGLIGANIGKSLSPALHEDAFAAAGAQGYYHLMDLQVLQGRATLESLLVAVRTAGFAGVNVTHPVKEAVLPLLDEVSPEAREIGAVNTVVIGRDGRTAGHNTDRTGFRRAFEEVLGGKAAARQQVLLLGAGGAGRAVACALMDLGVQVLHVFDTDAARAQTFAADLQGRFGADRIRAAADLAGAAWQAAGIVNATPIGMLGYPGMAIAPELIDTRHWVADVVYTPLETQLIATARRKGCRVMTGGGMCVHQAAEAFRLFTGLEPDVARMHRLFNEACARRDAKLAAAG